MTGLLPLDWLVLSVSLFNTGLLAWLGLTVLLVAQPRSLGAMVAALSLLIAAAFFASHSILVGQRLQTGPLLEVAWQASLLAVVSLPFGWYTVALWYAGLWSAPQSDLRRRQLPIWLLAVAVLAVLLTLLVFFRPFPTLQEALRLDLSGTNNFGRIPLLTAAYPGYSLLCLGAALDALLRPGPATRITARPARGRARPWLVAASVLLVVVSLLVAIAVAWTSRSLIRGTGGTGVGDLLVLLGLDGVITSMIGVAIICIGQALAEYEVFTGRSLPRRGLRRYWRRAVAVCALITPPLALLMLRGLDPVYLVLACVLLLMGFLAVLGWRNFSERERIVSQLRPVAADPLASRPVSAADGPRLMASLCRDVIGAARAVLVPHGPIAAFVGPPLAFPVGEVPDEGSPDARPIDFEALRGVAAAAGALGAPLDHRDWHGLRWVIEIRSDRGPIGLLALGRKVDGGLYAQEDIELARAGCEQLLAALASAELTQRLIHLQRQRLAESQVLDRRLRRELHDDVLPRLHAAVLMLNDPEHARAGISELATVHKHISDLVRAMPNEQPEVRRHGLFGALRVVAEQEMSGAFDTVTLDVNVDAERRAARLPAFQSETLFSAAREAIRNAARHGRGAAGAGRGALTLTITGVVSDGLVVRVIDDGVGIASARTTPPDPSAPPKPGAQHGLMLHTTLMAVAGGQLEIGPGPTGGTCVTLSLPNLANGQLETT
jgi:signal transduction histidine kinase